MGKQLGGPWAARSAMAMAALGAMVAMHPGTACAGSFENLFGRGALDDTTMDDGRMGEGGMDDGRADASRRRQAPPAYHPLGAGYDGREDATPYPDGDAYGDEGRDAPLEQAPPRPRPAPIAPTPAGGAPITPLDDGTLRRGDVVMTANGPVVYVGSGSASTRQQHGIADFASPRAASALLDHDQARMVERAERDASHSRQAAGEPVTSGRSAADDQPVAGRLIEDARGRKVRYVGP